MLFRSEAIRAALLSELQQELNARHEILRLNEERQARVLAEPLEQVALRYLNAAESFLVASGSLLDCPAVEVEARRNALVACVEEMKWRGFQEAGDEDLLGHHRMLARLLSIKRDSGIGYRYRSGFEVLNAIRQSGERFASDWTVYLIAAKVFTPALNSTQLNWLGEWRLEVADRVRAGDFGVMRDAVYDRILGNLFPEMAESLSKPFGRRPAVPEVRWSDKSGRFEPAFQQRRSGAAHILSRSEPGALQTRSAESDNSVSWFLQGAELEAWKRANPESAKSWAPILKRLDLA